MTAAAPLLLQNNAAEVVWKDQILKSCCYSLKKVNHFPCQNKKARPVMLMIFAYGRKYYDHSQCLMQLWYKIIDKNVDIF